MTTEEDDEARIRELATLIEGEKDAEKLVTLAAELERLSSLRLERQERARAIADEKQRGADKKRPAPGM